jgi:hypothetical protein
VGGRLDRAVLGDRSGVRADSRRGPRLDRLLVAAGTHPPPDKLDITGVSYWAICVAALFEWEASAYKDNSLPWHPSLTDLINPLLGPHPIKSAAFLLWVLVGWALVRR